MPLVGVIMAVLLIAFTFLAQRATFGRHVYAVGGNAEAARRAGIRRQVHQGRGLHDLGHHGRRRRTSGLAAAVDGPHRRLGTILLDAIAAAVIGGTSLFGGRGFVKAALLGAMITQTIQNGIDLVGYSERSRTSSLP